MRASPPDDIPRRSDAEKNQRHYLKRDTGHHQVVTGVLTAGIVCRRGCHSATNGLNHKRDQIAADEDPGVPVRFDAGMLRPKAQGDMLEDEVNRGRIERRSQDQTADLDLETNCVKRIGIKKHPPNVAESLIDAGEDHGDQICPCLVADAEEELKGTAHGEESHEERVGANGRVVPIDGALNGTLFCHIGAEAEGDESGIGRAGHGD